MAPLEPWEKAIVDFDKFSKTTHGQESCIDCHGGVQSAVKDEAHTDMIASPSSDPTKNCGACHADQVANYDNALHNTQAGYWTAINARSVPENHPPLEEMFGNHCASCHTTCGECHVSQPANVGGGLFSGHVFEKTPPMTRSCTACHGSRVGNEFLGKNEGIPGDVHFREARMNCVKCHESADLHGSADAASAAEHRYAGEQVPACIDCHPTVAAGESENPMHNVHGNQLSCQVCHSVTYTSCDGCHVAVSEKSGKPFFETEATYSTFFIGRNPRPDENRPYAFVPVRHVPASPTSYQYYGENLLPNFNDAPTWVYSTPHNIQLKTPQNASCEACHTNAAIFLTADKINASEAEANASVVVGSLPPSLENMSDAPKMPAGHESFTSMPCTSCHGNTTEIPESHQGWLDSSCMVCHTKP